MTSPARTILLDKLGAVLRDLQESGASDGQAMFMLGAGADHLCSGLEATTWIDFKQQLDPHAMTGLLAQIDAEGQQALADDQSRLAYALQALGLSLTATGFDDETVRTATGLLDEIIENALALYRQRSRPN